MQYKQKNFLMAALTGVLSIVVLTAGDCGPSGGTTGTTGTTATEPYYEWHSVDPTVLKFGKDKLLSAVHSDGNFYFGTDGQGLVIWDGKGEAAANVTQKKGPDLASTIPVAGGPAVLTGTDKVRNLVEIGKKKVAFISENTGIGVVDDKAITAGWVVGASQIPAGNINTLFVAEGAANAKFLIAASATAASGIIAQPLAALVANWENGLRDNAAANFTKSATSFGVDKDGNLLIGIEKDGAAESGFQKVLKANIGVAGNNLTTARNAFPANLAADNGIWKHAKNALHVVAMGNRVLLATDDMLITIADITAGNASVKVADAVVKGIEKDGANGARVYTDGKGILYVKADGTLDATKAFGKSSLKTGVDLEAGKATDYAFSDKIISMTVVGKKTIYGTLDEGIVVREEKTRNKK